MLRYYRDAVRLHPEHPPPPAHVVRAFSGDGDHLIALSGGQGGAWRAGSVVLKSLDMPVDALRWQADALRDIRPNGFRVAAPLRTCNGDLVCGGWIAWPYLDGQHETQRWADVIEVGQRFHAAVADVARPAFLDRRTDNWAAGDRAAWGEVPSGTYAAVRHIAALTAHLRPVTEPPQLIHGDLSGNVLFHSALPPAVIDLAPYWRPPAFASAIVVADALVWEGADESLLAAVSDVADFGQYLARALIFRLVTEHLAHPDAANMPATDDPYTTAVELAITLATTSN